MHVLTTTAKDDLLKKRGLNMYLRISTWGSGIDLELMVPVSWILPQHLASYNISRNFLSTKSKITLPVCCFASLLKYLHTGAYIYLCIVNKLVSNVFAAILSSFVGEVSIRIPASVGRVCVTCSWRGMLHSGCCDNSHRFP